MPENNDSVAGGTRGNERAPARPASVVVIDDNPDILDLLALVLREEAGMTVYPAKSVTVALRGQSAAPDPTLAPALILLDMSLPGEDVCDAVPRLRAHPGWEHVPIVLCSGREDIVASANALAADYLRKPFDVDALLALAERYARQPVT